MAVLPDVVPVTVLLAVDSEDGERDGQIGCGTQLGQGGRDDRDDHLRRRPGKTAVEDAGPDMVPGFPGWLNLAAPPDGGRESRRPVRRRW